MRISQGSECFLSVVLQTGVRPRAVGEQHEAALPDQPSDQGVRVAAAPPRWARHCPGDGGAVDNESPQIDPATAFDLGTLINRRRAVQMIAGIGLLAVGACGSSGENASSAATTTSTDAGSSSSTTAASTAAST